MSHPHEAFENHDQKEGTSCRLCSTTAPDGKEHGTLGVCTPCWYKILIVIFIIMISISYVVWFGLL
jgi:hypothetical protein